MGKTTKCLDYESESGWFALGGSVAESIEAALQLGAGMLTPSQLELMRDYAQLAASKSVGPTAHRKDVHPLNKFIDQSPVYTSLAFSPIHKNLSAQSKELSRVPQLILILDWLGKISLSKSQTSKLGSFCIRVSKASAHVVDELSSLAPKKLDVEDIRRAVNRINTFSDIANQEKDIARVAEYREALGILVNVLVAKLPSPAAPPQSIPAEHIKTTLAKPARRQGFSKSFQRFVERKTEDCDDGAIAEEPALIIAESLPSPKAALSIARQGHLLRLQKLFAAMSEESLPPASARLALDALVGYESKNDYESIAVLIWKLVAVTGHQFDQIFAAICGQQLSSYEVLLGITKEANRFTWQSSHLIEKKLSNTKHGGAVRTSFSVSVLLPRSRDDDAAWACLKGHDFKALESEVLEAKKSIKKQLRTLAGLAMFTETRLRGTLVQQVFSLSFDLPLTQYLFGERLEFSAAGLHYVVWQAREIQNALNLALFQLYGDRLPYQGIATGNQLIGAPKAAEPKEILLKSVDWFNQTQAIVDKPLRKNNREEKHNAFARSALHLLSIGTAHRQAEELAQLHITDIHLEAGLVLLRDKASDPSVYRRLACMPSSVARYVEKYLFHLQKLEGQAWKLGLQSLATKCAAGLKGAGPIFFEILDDQVVPILSPSELASQVGLEGEFRYIARHLQSTRLRQLGAQAILVEAHLGHQIGGPLCSSSGVVAPVEMAEQLVPYLDQWLVEIGYLPNQHLRNDALKLSSAGLDFESLVRQEHKEDVCRFRAQTKKHLRVAITPQERKELVVTAIQSVVKGYSPEAPPKGISLSETEVLSMRAEIASVDHANLVSIERSVSRLRKELEKLTRDHGWNIETSLVSAMEIRPPIPLTRGHLAAAVFVSGVREWLIGAAIDGAVDDGLAFVLSLLLWGQSSSTKEALSIGRSLLAGNVDTFPNCFVVQLTGDLEDQSRSVGGVPALFAARLLSSKGALREAVIGSEIQKLHHQFVEACLLAQYVYMPISVAELVANKTVHKEAHAADLTRLFKNLIGGAHTPLDKKGALGKKKAVAMSEPDDEKWFNQLRRTISDPPRSENKASHPRLRSSINAVRQFKTDRPLSSLMQLFVDWSLVLLGKNANLKTGKELHKDTVCKYLALAWVPMSAVAASYSLDGLEPDELKEKLDASFSLEPTIADAQARALNRLFHEMSGAYDLPAIAFSIDGNSAASIEAGLISHAEHRALMNQFANWRESPQLSCEHLKPLNQMENLGWLYKDLGMRRNEALYLQHNDISCSEGTWATLRWHKARSVKSAAARRFVELEKLKLITPEASTERVFDRVSDRHLNLYTDEVRRLTETDFTRLHHYRHSYATERVPKGFYERNANHRIRSLAKVVAEIGHSNIRTTQQFYVHSSHFMIASIQSQRLYDLQNKYIAALLRKRPTTVNAAKSRCSRESFFTGLLGKGKKEVATAPPISSLPPMLAAESSVSYRDYLGWLHRFAAGYTATEAAGSTSITTKKLSVAIDKMELVSRQMGWFPVPLERLQSETRRLASNSVDRVDRFKEHKRFPQNEFDALVGELQLSTSLLRELRLQILGLRLTENTKLVWSVASSSADLINGLFRQFHAPIELVSCDSHLVYEVVPTKERLVTKHSANCIRLALFYLIFMYELSLDAEGLKKG